MAVTQAATLIDKRVGTAIIGDRAYDADALIEHVEALGMQAVIPSRVNRKTPRAHDALAYRTRNVIERFFGRLKQYRRDAFNRWKLSAEAGRDESGESGLSWRREICQQVFEEAAVDLGRALAAFSSSRKGERRGRRVRLPRFKKKSDSGQSFRVRNKQREVRVGEGTARMLRLPKIGVLAVRESTRKLRRMLKKGRAKILFATVREGAGGRWTVSLNVEAAPLHPARQQASVESKPVGIDRGLHTFAVVADAEGREFERIESARPLRAALPKLRRRSRALSRKHKGSRNRRRARERLGQLHRRIADVRRDFAHRQSSRLAKTHGHLVLETLCTIGLINSRMPLTSRHALVASGGPERSSRRNRAKVAELADALA